MVSLHASTLIFESVSDTYTRADYITEVKMIKTASNVVDVNIDFFAAIMQRLTAIYSF